MSYRILRGDVLSFCRHYKGPKIHALLCDPPYSLKFMGKDWDHDIAFHPETWAALAEHLHPGAFGMAFASARGWHRLAVAIEDAGLRLHPSIFGWCYGSGFPKATRIDTQIDEAAGAERKDLGPNPNKKGRTKDMRGNRYCNEATANMTEVCRITEPSTDLARAWAGHRYGLQSMKPSLEPIIVFQKPYRGKAVECITETGAGALNIDGARIAIEGEVDPVRHGYNQPGGGLGSSEIIYGGWAGRYDGAEFKHPDSPRHDVRGRWPANFYLDEEAARRLGEQSGEREVSGTARLSKENKAGKAIFGSCENGYQSRMPNDTGTAARFFLNVDWKLEEADPVFYCAKASRKERDAGLGPRAWQKGGSYEFRQDGSLDGKIPWTRNHHPTVKPLALCKWLATLLLPPEEYAPRRILIPFAGSGSEMISAALVGWEEVIGIEQEKEYVEIARARLKHWTEKAKEQPKLL